MCLPKWCWWLGVLGYCETVVWATTITGLAEHKLQDFCPPKWKTLAGKTAIGAVIVILESHSHREVMNSDILTSCQEAFNICSTPRRLIRAQATSKTWDEHRKQDARWERDRKEGRERKRERENERWRQWEREIQRQREKRGWKKVKDE